MITRYVQFFCMAKTADALTAITHLPVGKAGRFASMYSGGVPFIQPISCCRGEEDSGRNMRTCNSCAPGTVGR